MANVEKIDVALFMALRAYEENPDKNPADGMSITLRFKDDLQSIEALGFETLTVIEDEAVGIVRFKDIDALTAHPGVISMAAGQKPRPNLDFAALDINARATGTPPVDGLWHAEATKGDITGVPDGTGKDVIVAILDSGIDYKHPSFMKDLGPPMTTRILSIWDQGLRAAVIGQCPDANLLTSRPNTYGVEYETTEIENDLNGITPLPFKHVDCIGHGTHVAGIAAGGGRFYAPAGKGPQFVGVAPEASIIAVKLLDNPSSITYFGTATPVGGGVLFRDAVIYCLRKAKLAGKPVVINMSFGAGGKAGDGLDDEAIWMDRVMNPGAGASDSNFPTRAVLVKSAGNEGDEADFQTALIKVAAGTEVIVPMELVDDRGGLNTRWDECKDQKFAPPIGVDFWYRRTNPFTAIEFALRLPHQPTFSPYMGVGGHLETGFVTRVGPPPTFHAVASTARVHRAFVLHGGEGAVEHSPGGQSLRRHKVAFWVLPRERGSDVIYEPATYEIRIRSAVDVEVYAMCDSHRWARGKNVFFKILKALVDPAIIKVSNKFSAIDTGGRHVITVAAYDDKNGAGPKIGEIAKFSSRGPLRDFSDPALGLGPIALKPDIAAPGVGIMSAESLDMPALPPPVPPRSPDFDKGDRYVPFGGTSMAAPMVAGVIALLLDKKPDLNTTQVRDHLTAVARAPVDPAPGTDEANEAYGTGMVDALASHGRL